MVKQATARVDGADGLVGSEVPYLELGGHGDGPTVCLMAGVHGCEYASMLGLRRFLAGLDEAELRGRLLVVPIANLAAFHSRTPFVVPHDGLNLNRCFPGDPAGSFTERLAYSLFEAVVRRSDYHLDLHAGDQVEALAPFTIFDASPAERSAVEHSAVEHSAVEQRSRDLAYAYGLGFSVVVERSDSPIAGTSSTAAAEAGIPAITAEAGQCGLVEEEAVGLHVRGITSVLSMLGVLARPYTPPPPPVQLAGWLWLRSEQGGWWEPAVRPGEQVTAGRLLGTVTSLAGHDVEEVHAPRDGFPLFITSSPAVARDGLLLGLALG